MDTRDYRSEINAYRKRLAGLYARKTALGAMSGTLWLGEKLLLRTQHSRLRQNTLTVRKNVNAGIASTGKSMRRLETIAAEVESREGELVQCVRCHARFRGKFGGQLPDKAQWVMGSDHDLARMGWLCHRCWPPAIERLNDILACYGAFVGVSKQTYIPGFRIVADGGWIATEGEFNTIEDAKDNLRLVASRRLANGCVSFRWDEHRDAEVAGYSRNGNPYYRTVVTYSGQARAVALSSQ